MLTAIFVSTITVASLYIGMQGINLTNKQMKELSLKNNFNKKVLQN